MRDCCEKITSDCIPKSDYCSAYDVALLSHIGYVAIILYRLIYCADIINLMSWENPVELPAMGFPVSLAILTIGFFHWIFQLPI